MGDPRYRERGYSTERHENESGAYLTVSRNGEMIAEISLGIGKGGRDQPVGITVRRVKPNELREVEIVDDYEHEN